LDPGVHFRPAAHRRGQQTHTANGLRGPQPNPPHKPRPELRNGRHLRAPVYMEKLTIPPVTSYYAYRTGWQTFSCRGAGKGKDRLNRLRLHPRAMHGAPTSDPHTTTNTAHGPGPKLAATAPSGFPPRGQVKIFVWGTPSSPPTQPFRVKPAYHLCTTPGKKNGSAHRPPPPAAGWAK